MPELRSEIHQQNPQSQQNQQNPALHQSQRFVLVTGGAGFIGSSVCRELIQRGFTPLIVDMFAQYTNPVHHASSETWHARFQGIMDQVVIKRANCANYAIMYDLLEQYQPAYIIHLAALPLAKMEDSSPEDFKEGTVDATSTILHAVHRLKQKGKNFLKKFTYISSSMVYGNFLEDPVKETHRTEPVNVYGTMKLAGEYTTKGLCNTYKISYIIIRPSAVYGPTDINKRVSQLFAENAMHGKKLIVKGGDDERLDFSYVKDVAKGITLATLHPTCAGEIFNITGGHSYSLLDFARITKKYFPETDIEVVEREQDRPKRGGLDISKAKMMLDYQPEYDLEKGIKEYIEFLLAQKSLQKGNVQKGDVQ
ncbi:TPA: NAD(P)-dependent oxidoreductase [Candidatus Woesearchaeota archaeon]|nr:NAD(P)-dependent oxidoreductase [Candidatus Woesearchaeota archaeon]